MHFTVYIMLINTFSMVSSLMNQRTVGISFKIGNNVFVYSLILLEVHATILFNSIFLGVIRQASNSSRCLYTQSIPVSYELNSWLISLIMIQQLIMTKKLLVFVKYFFFRKFTFSIASSISKQLPLIVVSNSYFINVNTFTSGRSGIFPHLVPLDYCKERANLFKQVFKAINE